MPTHAPVYDPDAFADDLTRTIEAARQARTVRACLLTTQDRDYALEMLKKTAPSVDAPLHHFTVAGRRRFEPDALRWAPTGGETGDAHGLLRHAQELRTGGVVVLEDCVPFLRDEGGDLRARQLLSAMLSTETQQEGLVLVFLEPPGADGHLPAMLEPQFVRLSVPYPRAPELEAIAREEIARIAHGAGLRPEPEAVRATAERFGGNLVGLTRRAARDAVRDAHALDPRDHDGALVRQQRKKAEHLSRELGMSVLDTDDVEEPIGLDHLMGDVRIMRDRMRLPGPGRARGILLVGPPGTGKTMLARSIGRLVDLPVVEFRIAALMNSLLGETEQRFARAFATLEAMAPNVVFIDEIEKAFGDSSERDGGTMMRVTGSLLSWLSDNPYPNFIVATSNGIRRMGEIGLTMTRSGRFDGAYFVDLPSLDSRRRMLERWLDGRLDDPATTAAALAEATERFSGADLFETVKQAAARAEHAGHALSLDALRAEADRKRLRAIALYDEFADLRRWAASFCDPAGPTDLTPAS